MSQGSTIHSPRPTPPNPITPIRVRTETTFSPSATPGGFTGKPPDTTFDENLPNKQACFALFDEIGMQPFPEVATIKITLMDQAKSPVTVT
jgi:hypothetical protein